MTARIFADDPTHEIASLHNATLDALDAKRVGTVGGFVRGVAIGLGVWAFLYWANAVVEHGDALCDAYMAGAGGRTPCPGCKR